MSERTIAESHWTPEATRRIWSVLWAIQSVRWRFRAQEPHGLTWAMKGLWLPVPESLLGPCIEAGKASRRFQEFRWGKWWLRIGMLVLSSPSTPKPKSNKARELEGVDGLYNTLMEREPSRMTPGFMAWENGRMSLQNFRKSPSIGNLSVLEMFSLRRLLPIQVRMVHRALNVRGVLLAPFCLSRMMLTHPAIKLSIYYWWDWALFSKSL